MQHIARTPSIADDLRRGIAACIAIVLIVVGAILAAGLIGPWVASTKAPDSALSSGDRWLVLLAFQAAMLGLTFGFARLFGPPKDVLGLHLPQATIRKAAVPFAVAACVLLAYTMFAWLFFREAVLKDLAVFQGMLGGVPIWLPVLVLVVGAPLSEEFAFRGLLLGQLRLTRLGFAAAAVLATIAWTALHMSYTVVGLIDVFLAGLLFSWSLWRTGSLWVPIAFHAIYNAIVLAIISIALAPGA